MPATVRSEPYAIVPLHRDAKGGFDHEGRMVVWLRAPSELLADRPDMKRAPSRYDVDVLLRLLALAVMGKSAVIHDRAFRAGGKAIVQTGKKRQEKKLFYKHHDRQSDESAEAFGLVVKEDNYMKAVNAVLGKPNRYAEKGAGKAAYKKISQNLRRIIFGNPYLVFASKRQLLSTLSRATNKPGNYRSLEDSLLYLSAVELRFARWYVGSVDGETQYERRTVRFLDRVHYAADGSITISLISDLLATTGRYFAKVSLPLPLTSEAALNLDLWLHAFKPFDLEHKVPRQFRRFCIRLGFPVTSPSKASTALNRALEQVNRNRKRRGEDTAIALRTVPDSDTVAFRHIRRTRQDDHDSYVR